ncbi:MAG TPA: hypothetical protein DCO89_03345 [Clostridiales bacterium]|nr:hypothetical protein [Clostridiales bacterium]
MKILRISKIFDFLFGIILLFFICFVWTRYFLHDVFLTLLISAIITFFISSIFYILNNKKTEKKSFSKQEIKNAKSISSNFLLSTKQEILKAFYEKFNVKYNTKIKSDYLLVNDKILKPIYTSQTITDKDVLETYLKVKDTSPKTIIITCKNANESCYDFAKMIANKKVIILTEIEAYENIFKPLQFDIPNIETEFKSKKTFQQFLEFALNKSRTKSYALVSVFMLFASFVLRYNIYYLIFSSITGTLALYSYYNVRYNKKPNDNQYL